jgi:hypothetical protein
MKSTFIINDLNELIERINKLTPETERLWGKMNVCQMLAHASIGVAAAVGEHYSSRTLMGRIFGGIAKKITVNDKQFDKNLPTHPEYIVENPEEFEVEKKKLIDLLQRMYDGGKTHITSNPHPFFGKLTPSEWGSLVYKHTDHHLRQFGV